MVLIHSNAVSHGPQEEGGVLPAFCLIRKYFLPQGNTTWTLNVLRNARGNEEARRANYSGSFNMYFFLFIWKVAGHREREKDKTSQTLSSRPKCPQHLELIKTKSHLWSHINTILWLFWVILDRETQELCIFVRCHVQRKDNMQCSNQSKLVCFLKHVLFLCDKSIHCSSVWKYSLLGHFILCHPAR